MSENCPQTHLQALNFDMAFHFDTYAVMRMVRDMGRTKRNQIVADLISPINQQEFTLTVADIAYKFNIAHSLRGRTVELTITRLGKVVRSATVVCNTKFDIINRVTRGRSPVPTFNKSVIINILGLFGDNPLVLSVMHDILFSKHACVKFA